MLPSTQLVLRIIKEAKKDGEKAGVTVYFGENTNGAIPEILPGEIFLGKILPGKILPAHLFSYVYCGLLCHWSSRCLGFTFSNVAQMGTCRVLEKKTASEIANIADLTLAEMKLFMKNETLG